MPRPSTRNWMGDVRDDLDEGELEDLPGEDEGEHGEDEGELDGAGEEGDALAEVGRFANATMSGTATREARQAKSGVALSIADFGLQISD